MKRELWMLAAAGLCASAVASASCANTAGDCLLAGECSESASGSGGAGTGGTGAGGDGAASAAPTCEDIDQYGGGRDQSAGTIALDSVTKDIVMAGDFLGWLSFGGAPLIATGPDTSFFVARFTPDLATPRAAAFSATYQASALDPGGNIVAVGTYDSSVTFGATCGELTGGPAFFMVKLGPGGKCLWSHSYPAPSVRARVGIDNDDLVLAGSFEGTLAMGSPALVSLGARDLFKARFATKDGALRESPTQYGGSGHKEVLALAFDANSNVLIAGKFDGVIDFANGEESLDSKGAEAGFVANVTDKGKPWRRALAATGGQLHVTALAVHEADVVVAGDFSGTAHLGDDKSKPGDALFLAALAVEDGATRWNELFGATGPTTIESIAVDTAGRMALTGSFQERVDFSAGSKPLLNDTPHQTIFVAELDSNGGHVASWAFGGRSGGQSGRSALWRENDIFVAGHLTGEVRPGAETHKTIDDGTDVFLARICAQ